MSRPPFRRRYQPRYVDRINNRIRAREVRVVDSNGQQLGVMPTDQALLQAKAQGLDLVEVAASARPPVCRIVDYGKYRYEQSKKQKENKKNQHGNKVKEVQLRPAIDPHDLKMKVDHSIDFLCDDMKVKVTLRYRGRENAHQEIGFRVMNDFVEQLSRYGVTDSPVRKAGRTISVMVSPLPKGRRAPHPDEEAREARRLERAEPGGVDGVGDEGAMPEQDEAPRQGGNRDSKPMSTDGSNASGFKNNAFESLEVS